MADSSCNNLTSLARALSQPTLNLNDMNDVTLSPTRSIPLFKCRRRKLSICNLIESVEPSPIAPEARVLVINTGGTIGMTLHDKGMANVTHSVVVFTVSQPASLLALSCCFAGGTSKPCVTVM